MILIGDRPEDLQLGIGHKKRNEKGESHDVVPMRMGQEKLGFDRPFGQILFHDVPGQLADPRARIDHHQALFFSEAQLQAGGVASVPHGLGTRTGNGPPHAPKSHPYRHSIKPL